MPTGWKVKAERSKHNFSVSIEQDKASSTRAPKVR
jgi:hypothetical protein